MAHSFDIRFARSAGLAAWFEAPANHFGWKGAGRLSIDTEGISIAVRRGLATWFTRRTHRIPATELTQVFREGDALRLEYGADDRRQVLPIWATHRAVAEQIVKLLPTLRTVEIDEPSAPRRFRWDRTLLAWPLLVAAIAVVTWLVLRYQSSRPVPEAPRPVAEAPSVESSESAAAVASPLPITLSAPELQSPLDIAQLRQQQFETELAMLRNRYAFVEQAEDADQLAAIRPEWWTTSFQIDDQESLTGPALTAYREAQLATLSSWRAALSARAAATRLRDDRFLALADRQRKLADEYELLARRYMR